VTLNQAGRRARRIGARVAALTATATVLATGLTVAVASPAGAAVGLTGFRYWGPNTQYNGTATTAKKVNDLAQLGNTLYVGGLFDEIRPEPGNGVPATPRPNLYAVDATTGAYLPAFAPIVNGQVEALEVDPQRGLVFVGGSFTQVNGADVPGFAILDATTGALAGTQRPVRSGGSPGSVYGLRRVGRQLYVGGGFGAIGGVGRGNLARLDLDNGAVADGFQVFITGLVRSMDVDPANPGRVYVGGEFSGARTSQTAGTEVPGTQWLAAFHTADSGFPPGRVDTNFIANVPCSSPCTNPTRGRKVAARNGRVYVAFGGGGGRFIIYDQADARTLRTYNVDGDGQAVGVDGDRVYFGGHFTRINNPALARCQVFAVQATGSYDVLPDPAIDNGAHLGVFSILVPSPGQVLLGGMLPTPNTGANPGCDLGNDTTPYNHIVRLVDGAVSDTAPPSVPSVAATSAAFTSLNLSWSASSDTTGVSAYYVYVDGVRRTALPGGQTSFLLTGLAADRSFRIEVQALDPYGNRSALSTPVVVRTGDAPPALPSPLRGFGQFWPTEPNRILDTRSGVGGPPIPVAAGAPRSLQVTGVGGVPATGVQLVALNVTVTQPTAAGFLTAYPGGEPAPQASNLNFRALQTVPNLVVARVGAGGAVELAVSAGRAHVLADVVGWFATNDETRPGARIEPQVPERALDTRNGTGRPGTAPLGAGEVLEFQVVPPGQGYRGVVVNLTGIGPTQTTFLTAFPGNQAVRPTASNLNLVRGEVRPNLAMVGVSDAGTIKVYNHAGSVHLAVDVVARFRATTSLDNNPAGRLLALDAPLRMVDTRAVPGTPIGRGTHRWDFAAVQGSMPGGVAVQGLVLNATATRATTTTFLTLYPGGAVPTASNLNVVPGQDVPNLAVAQLTPSEQLDVYNFAGSLHYIFDVTALVLG
jgi:hypothetical protein